MQPCHRLWRLVRRHAGRLDEAQVTSPGGGGRGCLSPSGRLPRLCCLPALQVLGGGRDGAFTTCCCCCCNRKAAAGYGVRHTLQRCCWLSAAAEPRPPPPLSQPLPPPPPGSQIVTLDADAAAGAAPECADNTRAAFATLLELGGSPAGRASLRKAFRLCDELKGPDDVSTLAYWLQARACWPACTPAPLHTCTRAGWYEPDALCMASMHSCRSIRHRQLELSAARARLLGRLQPHPPGQAHLLHLSSRRALSTRLLWGISPTPAATSAATQTTHCPPGPCVQPASTWRARTRGSRSSC
jgi:hypothetical protein